MEQSQQESGQRGNDRNRDPLEKGKALVGGPHRAILPEAARVDRVCFSGAAQIHYSSSVVFRW
jgi:hypothetical protein